MSLSPKDMDFMEARHSAAREIALAFGVPPMLLAIPGDNTYSNDQEANRVFWRQTVLPLGNRIGEALRSGCSPPSARSRSRSIATASRLCLRARRPVGAHHQGTVPHRQREAGGDGLRRDRRRRPPEIAGRAAHLTPVQAGPGFCGAPFHRASRPGHVRSRCLTSSTPSARAAISRTLALFLWATSATALAWFALRELAAARRRFDDFVRELARCNASFSTGPPPLTRLAANAARHPLPAAEHDDLLSVADRDYLCTASG
jgi:Phage portal protein